VGLLREEDGLSTLEYVIILVLVAVIGLVTWQFFGESVADSVDEAHAEIRNIGAGGSGRGRVRVGAAGDDVEAVGSQDPAASPAGSATPAEGEGENGLGGGAGETRVAGVVRDEGAISVYTAPGTEEETGGYGVLITIAIVVLLALGGVFAFFKAKGSKS